MDTRSQSRDSLFLVAKLRVARDGEPYAVKLRNISDAGVMTEGSVRTTRGQTVWLALPDMGWVEGRVAWSAGDRFGIAFASEIDSKKVRFPVSDVDLPAKGRHKIAND